MPFIIGAIIGGVAVYKLSDEASNLFKYGALAGGVYLTGKALKVW